MKRALLALLIVLPVSQGVSFAQRKDCEELKKEIAAKLDEKGLLVSMPIKTFFQDGGYKLAAGDQLKITATYDNTTGKMLFDGAMGIVVGYFVPADDSAIARLRSKPSTVAKN